VTVNLSVTSFTPAVTGETGAGLGIGRSGIREQFGP
jgi:hypothetical protein